MSNEVQTATLGRFWVSPQTARGTASSGTYYGFRANAVEVSPAQMLQQVNQTVGGNYLPSGAVKTGAWGGGGMVMQPALDDYIGWLLYGFAGSVSSVDNGDGTYSHYFPSGADTAAVSKYFTARRKIPGSSTNNYEQIQDTRLYRMLIASTPGQYANFRGEFLGRIPTNPDGEAWTFTSKDPADSCPVACNGIFQLPSGSSIETATDLTIDMVNMMPDMRRMFVQASPYPYDFPFTGRSIGIQFTYLYTDPTLYNSLYYSAGAWNSQVYNTTFKVRMDSAEYAAGTTPFSLEFYVGDMQWQAQPMGLRGGDIIEMRMTGSAAQVSSGFDWYLKLVNATASYSWPS